MQASAANGWGLLASLAYVEAASIGHLRAKWCGGLGDPSGAMVLRRTLGSRLTVGHAYTLTLDYTVTAPVGGGNFGMAVVGVTSVIPGVGVGAHTQSIGFTYSGSSLEVQVGIGELAVNVGRPIHDMTVQGLVLHDDTADEDIDLAPDDPTVIVETEYLEFGYPLVNARAWTAPPEDTDRVTYASGESTAWLGEQDALLEGTVLAIPPALTVTSLATPVSGWNGPAGWQAFLAFAWTGAPFLFHRDRLDPDSAMACQLVEPLGPPTRGPGFTRSLTLQLRSVDLSRFDGY